MILKYSNFNLIIFNVGFKIFTNIICYFNADALVYFLFCFVKHSNNAK